ncbi:hypothetical protein BC829DRAFT_380699 [Chytridium lagenaria]|nr:hypothetical protein BC829DRAFT_380699 [Chytridium lagenaria]
MSFFHNCAFKRLFCKPMVILFIFLLIFPSERLFYHLTPPTNNMFFILAITMVIRSVFRNKDCR